MSEISVKATYGISKLANSIPMLGAEDYMRAYMRDMIMSGRWQNADFYQEYKDQIWNTNPSRFQFYPDLCLQNGIMKFLTEGGQTAYRTLQSFR